MPADIKTPPHRVSADRLDIRPADLEAVRKVVAVLETGLAEGDNVEARLASALETGLINPGELENVSASLGVVHRALKAAGGASTAPEAHNLSPSQIGQIIAGEGIYLGQWQPKDRSGNSLGKTYDVFAAPEDLKDPDGSNLLLTYKAAVREVASRRNWHGHNGRLFENDTALHRALKDDTYNGEWFIPTRDLLIGTDVDGRKVQADNLYRHKDTGALKDTFTTSGSGDASWFWSSTELRDYPSGVWSVRFTDGNDLWSFKDNYRSSCRPCRVRQVSHLTL
jgi:hypothetical protein